MLLQGENAAGREPALVLTHPLAMPGQGWVAAPGTAAPAQPALTALIFFHCRSSSALSLVSLKRRVLRPSDILMPYWKAALEKEQDMAQHSQGIHSLPQQGTHLPSHEHMLQSWPEPPKAVPRPESSRVTLKAKHQAQDPQLLLRISQGSPQLALSYPSTQAWPAWPSHSEPSLGPS